MAVSLNSDIWKNWEKTGKTDFIKTCVQLMKDKKCSPALNINNKTCNLTRYINTLITNGIKGVIKKETVVTTLQELCAIHLDVPSLILDILNISDAETSAEGKNEDSKERLIFCYFVRECEKFLSDKLLKERLEIDTLQEAGILKNRNFYTKFIKVKTKLYYKQRKFNLLREESEGFAKLITELNQEFNDKTNYTQLLDIVKSLIGCFNLDPNRVLDVILESFENKPEDGKIFVPLIKSYMNDPKIIAEVLGSKYTFYCNSADSIVPKSLYTLTAHLLKNSLIDLDDIYLWLTPEDKVISKEWETEIENAKEYVRKLQIISLNVKEKEDAPEEKEITTDKYVNNQKLSLCQALLEIGDWENSLKIISRLPEHYSLEYQPVAKELCNVLNYIIEPVYRSNCKLGNKIKGRSIDTPIKLFNLKVALTFNDLIDLAFPMLEKLGPSIRLDTVLMYKIIRLCRAILASYGIQNSRCSPPENADLYYKIVTLFDTSMLPALSYLDCNCCIAEEIWNVLKLYPYQIRYCLYSRWKNETFALYPELLRKRGDAEKQIKNIMKRVSKENVKPVGRHIGKLTHSSPGFLFDYVLLQIQVYDNLIHPVVDSLKYLTSLSYDVLGCCLIECLSNADKKRVKHDSTSISNWLQSLSSFCGAVFKKYNIELTGLLQYVANQLKAQKSLDLLILKEVVQKMAGVEAAEDLTIEQLNAMSGGELLKAEAGYFSQVRNTKKSSIRLKEAMSDQNLAVALCLLMAQQKYCIVYKETQKSHLKLVGKLSDQCQDTLVQFGTFLGSTLSVDEYVNKLPSIQSMLLHYHIPNEVAFFLARPMFNHTINIRYDQLRKSDPNYKKLSTQAKQQKYYEAVKEIMEPVYKSVIPLHNAKVWEDISPQFFVTFWSLTMYDLYVPDETYLQVINKIKQQSLSILDNTSTKGKKEQERYITLIEKLQDEKKKQHEHVDKVLYRLAQEKDTWFFSKMAKVAKNETITRFLQLCLFPRCTFTAVDAIYCAKFVHTIHMLKTPNFSTLLCYDRLFCDVTYSVTCCTENEAMRYGRFLYGMLETVMHWHGSKEVFEKECANYPGFVTKFRVCNKYSDNHDQVEFENFRHVCHKWHFKLAKALIICLDSKDYVQIRNSLIILIKIIPFFPVLLKLSQVIDKKIEKVREEEKNKRQDIFTLATSYLGQLKQRISAGHMMKESEFHIAQEREKIKQSKSYSDNKTDSKQNGEIKESDENSKGNSGKSLKERPENKKPRATIEDNSKLLLKQQISLTNNLEVNLIKDKGLDKEKILKEENKEKHSKKEEKREDPERERHSDKEREREREKRKERKEEKLSVKEERSYREERYIEMVSPKEDVRFSSGDADRYYDERGDGHYYHETRDDRERELALNSNSSSLRQSQEIAVSDRDVKRRKMDTASSKSTKYEERGKMPQPPPAEFYVEKPDKKERSSKTKEKREKMSDEEKELRKERKIGRKRDRIEEALNLTAEMKRRREEEKAAKSLSHSNGDYIETTSPHPREKHHHTREKSPYLRERERSHDRVEVREKQRSTDSKRR